MCRDDVRIMLRGSSHDVSGLVNARFYRDQWRRGFEAYDLSVLVSDVVTLHADLTARGAAPNAVTDRPYVRDVSVTLSDGYEIVFLQLRHQTDERQVENTIPVLAVSDVDASIRFYVEVLGFKFDWRSGGNIASVSREGHAIMLQRRTPVVPGSVWIGGPVLYEQWTKLKDSDGVTIVQTPTNEGHALEMRVADPDGNILWFGAEPLKDVPFGQKPEWAR